MMNKKSSLRKIYGSHPDSSDRFVISVSCIFPNCRSYNSVPYSSILTKWGYHCTWNLLANIDMTGSKREAGSALFFERLRAPGLHEVHVALCLVLRELLSSLSFHGVWFLPLGIIFSLILILLLSLFIHLICFWWFVFSLSQFTAPYVYVAKYVCRWYQIEKLINSLHIHAVFSVFKRRAYNEKIETISSVSRL